MCFSLKTLMSIIRTGEPIQVELIDLVSSAIIFSNDLIQVVNFLTRIIGCDSHSPALFHLSTFSEESICLKCLSKELKPKLFKSKSFKNQPNI